MPAYPGVASIDLRFNVRAAPLVSAQDPTARGARMRGQDAYPTPVGPAALPDGTAINPRIYSKSSSGAIQAHRIT